MSKSGPEIARASVGLREDCAALREIFREKATAARITGGTIACDADLMQAFADQLENIAAAAEAMGQYERERDARMVREGAATGFRRALDLPFWQLVLYWVCWRIMPQGANGERDLRETN